MELKPAIGEAANFIGQLLIVPYGIETIEMKKEYLNDLLLLIVPYGIETRQIAVPI